MTLSKLWQEMMKGNYSNIEQLTGTMEGDNIQLKAQKFLENPENASLFPQILLYGMALKANADAMADEIIKLAIIKMSEIDQAFQKDNNEAVDEIVKIIPHEELHSLLKDAVYQIDQYIGYEYGRTLLHQAAFNLRSDIIKLLCEGGVNIDKLDKYSWCALTIAMNQIKAPTEERQEVVKILFEYKPNIYAGNISNQSIGCAADKLSLWGFLFTEYAHKTGIIPGKDKLTNDIKIQAELAYMGNVPIGALSDFYYHMGWDTECLGDSFIYP